MSQLILAQSVTSLQPDLFILFSSQAVYINEMKGQLFYSNNTMWVYSQVLFDSLESLFDGKGLSSVLQCPRGGVPAQHGHWLLCVGLLAEPGGSAGNHCCLHDPSLRAAATNQPLEVNPTHLCTRLYFVYLTKDKTIMSWCFIFFPEKVLFYIWKRYITFL